MAASLAMVVLAIVAACLCLLLGVSVFIAQPTQRPNRRFATLMIVEAAMLGTFYAGANLASNARIAYPIVVMGWLTLFALPWFYLSFIGTVQSRFVPRWMDKHGWLVAMLGGLASAALFYATVRPRSAGVFRADQGFQKWALDMGIGDSGPAPIVTLFAEIMFVGLVGFYGLMAAVSAWRTAELGTPRRRRSGWLAIGFAVRDGWLTLAFLGAPLVALALAYTELTVYGFVDRAAVWLISAVPLMELAFVPLVAFAIVRSQAFGLELKVKRRLPKGLVVLAIVLGFVIISETIEAFVSQRAGFLAGILTAAGLAIAFRPLERLGDRLVGKALPHVEDTEAYKQARRKELYRDAFEAVLADGTIRPHERVALKRLAERLQLEDVQSIEDEVLPPMRMPAV